MWVRPHLKDYANLDVEREIRVQLWKGLYSIWPPLVGHLLIVTAALIASPVLFVVVLSDARVHAGPWGACYVWRCDHVLSHCGHRLSQRMGCQPIPYEGP